MRTLLLLFLLVAPVVTRAQAVFYPDHLGELNMGEVEYRRPRRDSLQFRNTGNRELIISRIESSCGCLDAHITPASGRIPAKMNNRGWVVVEYDGQLLGQFERYVKVYANDQKEPHIVYFRGRVVKEILGSPTDFPIDLGTVRMNGSLLDFGFVAKGERPQRQLRVFNASKSPYRPALHHLPPYLTAESQPEVIASERTGTITLTLHTDRLPALGLRRDAFFLAGYSESVQTEGRVNSTVVLTPDFSHLTSQQRAAAPRLTLSADSISFDEMGKKKKQVRTVEFTNTGREPLRIYSLEQLTPLVTTLALSAQEIAPAAKARLTLTITRAAAPAAGTAQILLLTNDPQQPARYITVRLN